MAGDAEPDATLGGSPHHGRTVFAVLRRGWPALLASLVLTYLTTMLGMVVAANVARGLAKLELNLFADDAGAVPVGVGVASYVQGLLLLGAVVVASASALLSATVEVTRSVRSGEDVRPWTPFRRGLGRAPAVARSLGVLAPVLALVGLVTLVLLVLSVVTVPLAALTGLVWLLRRSARRPWMRWPLAVAVPFGLLASVAVRWSLWLPFVVVDGESARGSLRASRTTVRARWWETARPLAAVVVLWAAGVAGVTVATDVGAEPVVLGAASIVVMLVLVLGWAVTVTVLHESHTGSVPVPRDRELRTWNFGFRPSPTVVLAVVVGLLGQGLWIGPSTPAGAVDSGSYVVNTIADAPAPDLGVECLSPEATCTLRGAVGQVMASPTPGATITFAVSGTIDLVAPLEVRASMAIDGAGERVTLRNPAGDSTIFAAPALGGEGGGEGGGGESPPGEVPPGESPPNTFVFRNLTILGAATGHASSLVVSGGHATVDAVTFTGNLYPNDYGSAILNAGTLSVLNSTFVDNAAGGGGGTIMTFGAVDVVNSTFFDNDGGGISAGGGGSASIANSLFKGEQGGFNCPFDATVTGNLSNDPTCASEPERTNLTNLALGLGSFADHGGWVDTIALNPTSAAVGAADPLHCPPLDARGESRPIPPTPCDVGAYQSAAGTTTSVSVPENPTAFGSPVTVSVTVAHPQAVPTGSVELSGGPGDAMSAVIVGGAATFTLTDLPVGVHPLTATYVPDGSLDASVATLELTIVKQVSQTGLTVSPSSPSTLGAPLTLTAEVRNGATITGAVPTGTVEFRDGATVLATEPIVDGTASAEDVSLAGGVHDLTATYSGDDGFEASASANVAHSVQSGTVVALTAPSAATFGEPLELSGSVTSSGSGGPDATGSVSFYATTTDGAHGYSVGYAALVAGVGSTTTGASPLPVGTYNVVATYAGDGAHAAGTSEPTVLTISAAATETVLTGPGAATVVGEPAPFTAVVTADDSPATPEGDVEFRVDGALAATVVLTGGSATYAPTDLHASGWLSHAVTATFVPADASFAGSESAPVVHDVGRGATTTALSAPEGSVVGEPVSLVAVVSPVAPSTADPIGSVSFAADGEPLGTVALVAGTATLPVTDLPVGTSELTAAFLVTDDLFGSESAPVDHEVAPASTAVEVTPSPISPTYGEAVTLTATVVAVAPGSGAPSGSITFRDGTTVLGTVELSAGLASLTVSTLSAGVRSITADYDGDDRYLADEGMLSLTIAKAISEITISSISPTPSRYGDPVTFTAQVTSPTDPTPTGPVDFIYGGSQVIGQAPVVDGVATLTVADLPIGTTIVGAHFLGDDDHAEDFTPTGADHTLLRHTVLQAIPDVAVTTDVSPTLFGERVRVLVDVDPVLGMLPTGVVRIRIQHLGFAAPVTLDSAGHAQADFYPQMLGDLNIFATIEPDFFFEAGSGELLSHHVDPGTATVVLTASASPIVGSPTTLTATLTPGTTASVGTVRFFEGSTELGSASVNASSTASVDVTFATKGPHVVRAVYDGAFGPFGIASSDPITLTVAGRALAFGPLFGASTYGDAAALDVRLYTLDPRPPAPTGSIVAVLDEVTLGSAPIGEATTSSSLLLTLTRVALGRSLEPGNHTLTVTYSGDSTWAAEQASATFQVSQRRPEVLLDAPIPSPATVGETVYLSGRLVVPAGVPVPPTGSLTLGSGNASCVVPLEGGALGGSCTTRYDRSMTDFVRATYSGDARYESMSSDGRSLLVQPTHAIVDAQTTFHPGGFWTDSEMVTVTWSVRGSGTTVPTGSVQVVTNEGAQGCTATLSGTCQIRFQRATEAGWVEVRYSGSGGFAPAVDRVSARVVGCFNVTVASGGRAVTGPNCAGTKYVSGTAVELVAPARAGYEFAGWAGAIDGFVLPSPIHINQHSYLQPRYTPICATLHVNVYPSSLPRVMPFPAPNCDDLVALDGSIRDLDAIARAEVANGSMRYRVGTQVTLPAFSIRLNVPPDGLVVPVRWSGDGVGAKGVVTLDQDRDVRMDLDLPCRRVVVDGPPGAQVAITSTSFNTSQSPMLANNVGGRCTQADGTAGYLTGTVVRVQLKAGAGTWFDRWGPVERLANHRAPTGITVLTDRPSTGTSTTGATELVVPDHDVAISGFAAGVTCYELRIELKDAVPVSQLREGSKAPTVTATAPNCPGWWLQEQRIPTTGTPRWYLPGTVVTMTAGTESRHGYIDEYAVAKQIFFRRWTGDVTGDRATQTVTMAGPRIVVGEWYLAAACARIVVRTVPAGAGDVVTGGLDDQCPVSLSQFANVAPVPQARLGTTLTFAARPTGTLQPIWTVEGTSISNTEACRAREEMIAERYADGAARGKSRAEIDRILMGQGYLPGLTMATIQEEAAWRFQRGYTQAQIVGDLKLLGLLDANGTPAPDQLRTNPCDSTERNTTIPAGQRIISMPADGGVVVTAHFCQAVVPSVTIIELDGTRRAATTAELNRFGLVFRSSNAAGNCPTEGWFLPGTTAVLGSGGTGVPGYAIDGWSLDGVAKPAGALSVPITKDGAAHRVGLTVRVECQKLTVVADFGFTAYPLPNCPGVAASRSLYAKGTSVTVTAGESSGHVFVGWRETGTAFNPTLATMDKDVVRTTNFRAKTLGEQITETVIDPALNAVGVAAKKAVGGIAYVTKVVAQAIIEDAFLGTLSAIGDGLAAGFDAIGVHGQVLDGIVLGLQTPQNAFAAGLAGFDCIEEWAWGRSVPTLDDVKDTLTSAATGEAKSQVRGVSVDDTVEQARAIAARMEAGDPEALAQAYVAAAGGPGAAMVLAVVLDIRDNPDRWVGYGEQLGDYGQTFLEEEFGQPFTWETSASEAWSTGGDAFLSCMAENGRDMAGQGQED